MAKYKITFSDIVDAGDELEAFDELRAYLRECVEMEDITAFNFEHANESLSLSDYEKGFLTAHFEAQLRFEDYRCQGNAWYENLQDDSEWLGVQIGDRMFDICIFAVDRDEPVNYPDDLVAVVYECVKTADDNWTTKMNKEWFLKEGPSNA